MVTPAQTNAHILISIIIPCYNSGRYLAETLESVWQQSHQNFEIIAIDDGSQDDTLAILHKFAEQDSRIHVLSQSNAGVSAARNKAAAHAKGEYIVCLDSDDKISANFLEKTLEIAERNPKIAFVYGRLETFERERKKIEQKQWSIYDILGHKVFTPVTSLIRRPVFEQIGGFDERMSHCEDKDLYMTILEHGWQYCYCDEVCLYYRRRHDETSVLDEGRRISMNNINYSHDIDLNLYIKHKQLYYQHDLYMDYVLGYVVESIERKRKYYQNPIISWWYQTFKPKRWTKICQKYGINHAE